MLFLSVVGLAAAPDYGTVCVRLARGKNVSLGAFHRLGGDPAHCAPTDCRVAFNDQELTVTFRCTETAMAFPALSHGADWYAQERYPMEQDARFPDKVDLYVSPDLKKPDYYHFAVTLDGGKFGVKRPIPGSPADGDEEEPGVPQVEKILDFSASIVKRQEEWVATFHVPWTTVGGKPSHPFGLIPMRTRWREGEVTSPVAADFTDRPPSDLFIEACLPGVAPAHAFRWNRPITLIYPDHKTMEDIWSMQQTLAEPTTSASLSNRIELLQRWLDLLVLEGFNFRPVAGGIVTNDMSPSPARHSVNVALRDGDVSKACQLLDDYMHKLDGCSRDWFADGSPADIRRDQWQGITDFNGATTNGGVCVLHCMAGRHPVDLNLSFPNEGGVRLQANAEGFFKPSGLQPADLRGKVVIHEKPLRVSILTWGGRPGFEMDARDIAFRFAADGKILAIDFRHLLKQDEVIYGFGEKYDRLNQNGNVLTLWGVDDWFGSIAGLKNQTYKPIPLFHSSKGYSIFDNSSYRLRADIGKGDPARWRLTQHGPIFDFYISTGTPEGMLQAYTALTGRPLLPPKWAFEPWMGRTGRSWAGAPLHDPVAEEERVIKKFEELDIPHSAIYAEGSSADSPVLGEFAAAHGLHVLSWSYPCVPKSVQSQLLPGVPEADLPYLPGSDDYIDYSNPNAPALSRQWWAHRLGIGVAGSMVDFGDRVPEASVFHDGRRGTEMHNFYSYDYHRTVNQTFSAKRGGDFILFGRAASPGTQRWAGQFAGDHPSNFKGLKGVLTGALNLTACGFSTWGSDLGGFQGWPEPGVYMRWTEFGCFSPLMRCHGRTPRDPWEFGDAAVTNYKYYAWVRENLLDYIYASTVKAHETGIPMMRAMAVAFPDENALATVDDQYMFGPDLLVAPVVNEFNSRSIAFPSGRWTGLWDSRVIEGPATVRYDAPLDAIPVFIREGAVLPLRLGSQLQFGRSMSNGAVRAFIVSAPGKGPSRPMDGIAGARVLATTRGYMVDCPRQEEDEFVLIDSKGVAAVRVDGHAMHGWNENAVAGRFAIKLSGKGADFGSARQIEVVLH